MPGSRQNQPFKYQTCPVFISSLHLINWMEKETKIGGEEKEITKTIGECQRSIKGIGWKIV